MQRSGHSKGQPAAAPEGSPRAAAAAPAAAAEQAQPPSPGASAELHQQVQQAQPSDCGQQQAQPPPQSDREQQQAQRPSSGAPQCQPPPAELLQNPLFLAAAARHSSPEAAAAPLPAEATSSNPVFVSDASGGSTSQGGELYGMPAAAADLASTSNPLFGGGATSSVEAEAEAAPLRRSDPRLAAFAAAEAAAAEHAAAAVQLQVRVDSVQRGVRARPLSAAPAGAALPRCLLLAVRPAGHARPGPPCLLP